MHALSSWGYIYFGSISSLIQISLNIIDIFCLHIFFWIRSYSRIYIYIYIYIYIHYHHAIYIYICILYHHDAIYIYMHALSSSCYIYIYACFIIIMLYIYIYIYIYACSIISIDHALFITIFYIWQYRSICRIICRKWC